MLIARTINKLQSSINLLKSNNEQIGFIPTMGALHLGHLSLIECSKKSDDITVASIFVNPTQFNNKEDLKNYPRVEAKDLQLLEKVGCDIVFMPSEEEMYPNEDKRTFNFGGIENVMEGKFREGHFNGVAQIVSKLFQYVKPNNAYFGIKDFQQVAIIEYLNKNYLSDLQINIVACDILREGDGLAMSSRNQLLSKSHRKAAPLIQKTLKKYKNDYKKHSVKELMNKIKEEINKSEFLDVEYVDVVDNITLKTVDEIKEGETTACIAVFAGNVRLIDNIAF